MRQTMQPNSMQARVAGQYFKGITRRRITVEYTLDIFTHTFKHAHLDVVQFHRAQLSEFRSKYHAKYSLQIFSIGCAQKYGATVPLNALAWQGQENQSQPDRKSTRLNSSHVRISYAVFCLKKKIIKKKKHAQNNLYLL